MPGSPNEADKPRGTLASFLAELRRRRVNHVASVYFMVALGIIGSGGAILGNLGAPAAVAKWLTLVVIAGFPVAVAASWVYDLRLQREPAAAAGAPNSRGLRGAAILLAGIVVGMCLLGGVALLTRNGSVAATGVGRLPAVGVLPIRVESEADAWLTRALAWSITDALSDSRGVQVRTHELVEGYAGLPLDSMSRVLGTDYLVSARLVTSGTDSRLTVQVLDTVGTLVGPAATLQAGPPSRAAAEELTQLTSEHVLRTLGAQVRTAAWRFGTRSDAAFNLLYQADELFNQARALLGQQGGEQGVAGMLDEADALLVESRLADAKWAAPQLLRARVAGLRAYALRLHDFPPREIEAALDAGIGLAGEVASRDRRNAEALEVRGMLRYRKAAYLEPDAAVSESLLAGAESDLRASVRLEPDRAIAAAELSGVLFERGNFSEAASWAERALALDAYQAGAEGIIHRLAVSKFEVGQDTAALSLCRLGVRRFGSPFHHGCVIEVLAYGDVEPSVQDAWDHLATLRGDRLLAPQTLAFYEAQVAAVLARANQLDSARRVLERALHSFPPDPASRNLLALEAAVRFRLGQTDSALALLRSYVASGDPEQEFTLSRRALKPYRHLLAQEPPNR